MFIGRYDCIHAGVGYTNCNTRLHLYLLPNGQDESLWKQQDTVYFIHENIKCDPTKIYNSSTNRHQSALARQIAYKVKEKKRKRQQQTEKALEARKINQENIKCDPTKIYNTSTNRHQSTLARQIAYKVKEKKRKRQQQTAKALEARKIKQSKM
jgi:hypothetical protein